jgi:hypothetical protein
MLVCFQLRDVVLASPDLWTMISLSRSQKWIDLCMERSGNSDLTVIYPKFRTGHKNTYVARAKHLWLNLGKQDGHLYAMYYEELDLPNDRLRTLILNSYWGSFRLSTTFLGGHHDHLQVVILRQVNMVGRIQLPSLIRLELSRVGGTDPIDSILHLVSGAPRLEFLRLSLRVTSVGVDYEDTLARIPSISLANFRVFIVKARAVDTYVLLHALPYPTQKLRVDLGSTSRNGSLESSELSEFHKDALIDHIINSAASRSGSKTFARSCIIGGTWGPTSGQRYILDMDDDGRTYFTFYGDLRRVLQLQSHVRIVHLDHEEDILRYLTSDVDSDDEQVSRYECLSNAQFIVFRHWSEDLKNLGLKITEWLAYRNRIDRRIIAVGTGVYDGADPDLVALARGWKQEGLIDHLIVDYEDAERFTLAEPYLGRVHDGSFGSGWSETVELAHKLRLSPSLLSI